VNPEKYAIGYRKDDSCYYSVAQGNNIDMIILIWAFAWLQQANREEKNISLQTCKRILLEKGYIISECEGFPAFATTSEIIPESNSVKILCSFPWYQDVISSLLKQFPQYTQEDLENQEYLMPLDNYLETLNDFIHNYTSKTTFIIMYEEENKVRCKPYYPKEEEKKTYFWDATLYL
jgi:hypothetical protein